MDGAVNHIIAIEVDELWKIVSNPLLGLRQFITKGSALKQAFGFLAYIPEKVFLPLLVRLPSDDVRKPLDFGFGYKFIRLPCRLLTFKLIESLKESVFNFSEIIAPFLRVR
ncbi:MAG: hypothetical protein KatS3mg110_0873 [Pirellulaceae bacterium]|nr:MAG: hypothetical protein KatS3mg110_0873 [Pirellulaceae bacterium]